jgi:hypothetical protein
LEIVAKPTDVEGTLVRWLEACPRCILSFDAPLGWPIALRRGLADHSAGEPLCGARDELFSRETDRFVHAQTGKPPLRVGADRIAATAARTLQLIHNLRKRTGLQLPLGWRPATAPRKTELIEAYPAATLKTYGLPHDGYKSDNDDRHRIQRKAILTGIAAEVVLGDFGDALLDSSDAMDAVVCLIAARDYRIGNVHPPKNVDVARSEGWIWISNGPPSRPEV